MHTHSIEGAVVVVVKGMVAVHQTRISITRNKMMFLGNHSGESIVNSL